MPVQKTFTIVPTTLRNTTPRPPMTSKAAKKAYREATKLPKISKAERKRLEAEEIARQKKEYEKERAATKAKAAREKKLKKEAEEKAKRKAMGLPEPSRFVRPSQPTIKTFVKPAAGRKRDWEDIEVKDEGQTLTEAPCQDEFQSDQEGERPAKRSMLKREDGDDEDEFGDFPSLSQGDLPSLLGESANVSRTASVNSSPREAPAPDLKLPHLRFNATHVVPKIAQPKLDDEIIRRPLSTEARPARTNELSLSENQPRTVSRGVPSKMCEKLTEAPATLSFIAAGPQFLYSTPEASDMNPANLVANETSKLMPPPAVPMTVNRLSSRKVLRERPINIPSPSRTSKCGAVASVSKYERISEGVPRRGVSLIPPPSTLAFLEAHVDDFFPSPSQQVRELLEDVYDVPSNTQIAMEIGTTKLANEVELSITSISTPKPQSPLEGEEFLFLSSQDLEISSQDLRDIDTPSKPALRTAISKNGTNSCPLDIDVIPPLPRTPRLKPRFFEEKEDDLLHAALHESLSLAKLMTQSSSPRRSSPRRSSPRRSQEVIRGRRLLKSDRASDDYGYFGSDIEKDFLALLDGVLM